MNRMLGGLFAALLALAAPGAVAAPAALIERVQGPAWIDRAGKELPAAAGTELIVTDTVRTGAAARVYLRLGEGSIVKLGENARLALLDLEPDRAGVFKAALDVIAGAFRFTTEAVQKPRKRDVKIRIATVTAGIRGTDLWGRATPDEEIVCLIEGRIEVAARGEKPRVMAKPRQFYQRTKGKTRPLTVISAGRLAQLARETEIEK
jgi:hypothetical protein